jgi:hypothetical protein
LISSGEANFGPARVRVAIVFDRAAQSAAADSQFAVLCALQLSSAPTHVFELNVDDPPE